MTGSVIFNYCQQTCSGPMFLSKVRAPSTSPRLIARSELAILMRNSSGVPWNSATASCIILAASGWKNLITWTVGKTVQKYAAAQFTWWISLQRKIIDVFNAIYWKPLCFYVTKERNNFESLTTLKFHQLMPIVQCWNISCPLLSSKALCQDTQVWLITSMGYHQQMYQHELMDTYA